jgi:hypothetical protein
MTILKSNAAKALIATYETVSGSQVDKFMKSVRFLVQIETKENYEQA